MNAQVEIDEIDVKILRELVRDARAKLKDIAKKCSLSSTAVFNRIGRLKTLGVIKGAAMFFDMSQVGFMYPASIGIDFELNERDKVLKIIREQSQVIIASESAGSNTLRIFSVARGLKDIEDLKQLIRKQPGTRKVTISIWSAPHFLFDNVELEPSTS